MYAVVSTGGKQLKVEKGTEAVIERLPAEVGEAVTFDVLFIADGENVVVDADALASATVTAEVLEHFKGDKQIVFKFKKRKGYKRLKGHRQEQTRVRITDVTLESGKPSGAKAAEVAEEPAAVAQVEPGQCDALKSDGTRCSNKAKEGSAYCGVHAKKHDQ
ncbi:MAG: 50S ribosomal protein L21 [Coriobacteriia bacterium]|jgi:large subunit ribosomal protein L21|nr:50S ribosomal protein L21 [Coriobacteriia bacterium]